MDGPFFPLCIVIGMIDISAKSSRGFSKRNMHISIAMKIFTGLPRNRQKISMSDMPKILQSVLSRMDNAVIPITLIKEKAIWAGVCSFSDAVGMVITHISPMQSVKNTFRLEKSKGVLCTASENGTWEISAKTKSRKAYFHTFLV